MSVVDTPSSPVGAFSLAPNSLQALRVALRRFRPPRVEHLHGALHFRLVQSVLDDLPVLRLLSLQLLHQRARLVSLLPRYQLKSVVHARSLSVVKTYSIMAFFFYW